MPGDAYEDHAHVPRRLRLALRGVPSNALNVWWGELHGHEPRWVGRWRELTGDDQQAWRIGHHAGRVFRLREQARDRTR